MSPGPDANADGPSPRSEDNLEGLEMVQRMLARERLGIDTIERGRTSFLSHMGSITKLVPGPWIAHRDLLLALGLANLSPAQRTSLGRAVLVEHGREFGVGRLTLMTAPSGLPLGGASLRFSPRRGGPTCLYTWGLAGAPRPTPCDWLLLRAQPGWALDDPPAPLRAKSMATLDALGLSVVIAVATAAEARLVADHALAGVPFYAHPRLLPHVEPAPASASASASAKASKGSAAAKRSERALDRGARVVLWPHDALVSDSLARRDPSVFVMVDAPDPITRAVERWANTRPRAVEIRAATCPTALDRRGLASFWRACNRPRVLLRGDPTWTSEGARWLAEELGVPLAARTDATQLGLFS